MPPAVNAKHLAKHLFCFGLGYSATVLAQRLLAEGWTVAGTVRSPEPALEALGIQTHLFDSLTSEALAGASHILSSVPPNAEGDPVLPRYQSLIEAARPDWIGYLSTTGVYGDAQGEEVTEDSPLAPTSDRARRRMEAERLWRGLSPSAHLFRLAGIYGPGSSVLDEIRAGKAKRIDKPGQIFSRIHVEDIAQVVRASMRRPNPGRIYNVCDDNPAPPAEVVAHGCTLLGVEPPPLVPFAQAQLSPMAQTFWADNKRVSNHRMKQELGLTLLYPSYHEGLAQCKTAAP